MVPPDDKNKKNPWGNRNDNRNEGRSPWGGGAGGGPGGEPPPELDELLRRAQDNLRQVMPGDFRAGKLLWLALAGLVALWLASGFYIIQPGEQGVIQRFGAWTRTQTAEGLGYHLPWPAETVTKVDVSGVRRMEIGFTEETSGRGGPAQRQDVPDESLMLTSDANIINVDLVVLWNVSSAEDYLFNIRDPEDTIKKVAESAIREVVGQMPMFPIITTDRAEVARKTRDIMAAALDQYKSGVNVEQVLIQEAEVHPDVQDAFQDVQSARQDAFDAQNRAGAYREDILPKARGQAIKIRQDAEAYKQAAIARATGDAQRFDAIYDAYKDSKDVTKERLYIETMEDVLKNAQTLVLDDGKGGAGVMPYLPLGGFKAAPVKPAPDGSDSGRGVP